MNTSTNKVILFTRYNTWRVLPVTKVTPKGQIVVQDGERELRFRDNGSQICEQYHEAGSIAEWTAEKEAQLQARDDERHARQDAINALRNVSFGNLSTDKLTRMFAILNEGN